MQQYPGNQFPIQHTEPAAPDDGPISLRASTAESGTSSDTVTVLATVLLLEIHPDTHALVPPNFADLHWSDVRMPATERYFEILVRDMGAPSTPDPHILEVWTRTNFRPEKQEGNKRTGRASPVCPVQQEQHFVSPKEDQPSGVPDAVGIPRAGWALFKGTKVQRRPLRFDVSLTRKICKAIIEGTEKGIVSKAREYLVFINHQHPKH